jgi:hypothetical protein
MLDLRHGNCCPVNEGFVVVEDEITGGTKCVECGLGLLLKPDGTKCQLCNGNTTNIEKFCYDESIQALVSLPVDCYDTENLDQATLELCKKDGVANL